MGVLGRKGYFKIRMGECHADFVFSGNVSGDVRKVEA
jgi:hypothetical protein